MRTVQQCMKLKSSYSMTCDERFAFKIWLKTKARYTYDSYVFCCLIGWYLLDDHNIPLSPDEAFLDEGL